MNGTTQFHWHVAVYTFEKIAFLVAASMCVAPDLANTMQVARDCREAAKVTQENAMGQNDGYCDLQLTAFNIGEPSVCTAYSTSPEEFLDALKAIGAHGTLTDVGFIERSLNTKLQSKPAIGENNKTMVYETDSVFGAPVELRLHVLSDPDLQVEHDFIAAMRIRLGCPNIARAELEMRFGDNFLFGRTTHGLPVRFTHEAAQFIE